MPEGSGKASAVWRSTDSRWSLRNERIEEGYKEKRVKQARKKCTKAKKGKQKGQDKYTEDESNESDNSMLLYTPKLPYSLSHMICATCFNVQIKKCVRDAK